MSFTVNLLTFSFTATRHKNANILCFFYSSWEQEPVTTPIQLWIRVPEMSALSKAEASVPPLLSPSWSLNFNGTLILCWNYSFWVTQKPEKNMEQNKNESWQRTGIIILGLFLIGFQGIYNTWIQSLLSFSVLQQHSGSIMRQQAEQSRAEQSRAGTQKQDTLLHSPLFSEGKQWLPLLLSHADMLVMLLKVNTRLNKLSKDKFTTKCWFSNATSAADGDVSDSISTFMCSTHSNFTLADVVLYHILWWK